MARSCDVSLSPSSARRYRRFACELRAMYGSRSTATLPAAFVHGASAASRSPARRNSVASWLSEQAAYVGSAAKAVPSIVLRTIARPSAAPGQADVVCDDVGGQGVAAALGHRASLLEERQGLGVVGEPQFHQSARVEYGGPDSAGRVCGLRGGQRGARRSEISPVVGRVRAERSGPDLLGGGGEGGHGVGRSERGIRIFPAAHIEG